MEIISNMVKMSKTEKLINLLSTGANVETSKAAKKSGLVNVSSTINRLRNEGFRIFLNTKKTSKGVKNFYRMAA